MGEWRARGSRERENVTSIKFLVGALGGVFPLAAYRPFSVSAARAKIFLIGLTDCVTVLERASLPCLSFQRLFLSPGPALSARRRTSGFVFNGRFTTKKQRLVNAGLSRCFGHQRPPIYCVSLGRYAAVVVVNKTALPQIVGRTSGGIMKMAIEVHEPCPLLCTDVMLFVLVLWHFFLLRPPLS